MDLHWDHCRSVLVQIFLHEQAPASGWACREGAARLALLCYTVCASAWLQGFNEVATMNLAAEAAKIPSDMHLYFLKADMEVRGHQASSHSFHGWQLHLLDFLVQGT